MRKHNQIISKPIPEIILLLAIVISGVMYVRFTWTRMENEQSEKVLQIARSIEATLPIKELGSLEAKPGDIDKPAYQVIKNTLTAIIRVNPKARFAYIYTEQNGKLYFFADSEPSDSKDYSPPGQEYAEADIAYSQPFKNGKEIVTNPATDRWGTWITVLIPIKDVATGKTLAVFAMDFNAKSWNNSLLFEVIQSSMLMWLLLLTFLFLFRIRTKNKLLKNEIIERKRVENSLLNSENQKAAILRAIPDLLFIFNQNGKYLEVYTEDNSSLLLTKEALVGKNISDLFPHDIAGKAIDAINQSLRSKELVQFFYSTNISEKIEFYEARIVPASENTVLTIVRDITERKVAEEVFFQSRERSRAQRNAIARIAEDEDISSGNMIGSFEKITKEITVASQVGRASIWLFSEDKTAMRCISLFENATKKHSSGAILKSADYPNYFKAIKNESRISAADAQNDERTSEFAEGYLVPLGISSMLDAGIYAEGELKGVVCLEHTAEKRTWYSDEESFASTMASIAGQIVANTGRKHAERIMQAIITENPMSIQIIDKGGFTLQVNSAHTSLFGAVPPANYSVFNDFQLKQQGFGELIERVKNGEVVHFPDLHYNAHHLNSDFSDVPVWIQMVIFPLNDSNGKPERFVLMHENITGRKQAQEDLKKAKEKAEESDRLKTAFMNNISHEIRTPLNGILGFGQLMAGNDLTEDERSQYFAIVKSSSHRLMNTVTDYMDMSLIASCNQKVHKSLFAPYDLLDEIYNRFIQPCRTKKLTLTIQTPPMASKFRINSDHELLFKVVSHLVDNAIKFTLQGTVSFGFEVKGPELEFFVKDTGVGINKEVQPTIFGKFIQENVSNTRGHEGSGLGLSIAKGFVELLGGRIWIESNKGKGSAFFFTLPVEMTADEIPVNQQTIVSITAKPLILIAEDEVSGSELLERILRMEGIDSLVVTDGQQAVAACRQNPLISLVLMDMKMPVMDGFEATKEIKSFRPTLPVIAITAYALSGDENKALKAGCDNYIAKPFERVVLLSKLKKYGLMVLLDKPVSSKYFFEGN